MRRDRDFEILYKITCIYIHIVKIFNLHLKVIHYALSYNKSYQLLQKIFRKSEIPILRYTKFLPRYTYVYGVYIPQVYGIQYTPLNTYQSQSYILSLTVTIFLQTLDSSVQSTIYQVCHKNIHILLSSTYSFYFSLNYMSLRTRIYPICSIQLEYC